MSVVRSQLRPYEIFSLDLTNDPISNMPNQSANSGALVPVYATIDTDAGQFAVTGVAGENKPMKDRMVQVVHTDPYIPGVGAGQVLYPDIHTVSVGRRHSVGATALLGALAPTQFVVQRNGVSANIINSRSETKTVVTGNRAPRPVRLFTDTYACYSQILAKHLADRGELGAPTPDSPYGYFRGYKILGRDSTSVRDSVLLNTMPMSEAMYVDNESPVLKGATRDFVNSYLGEYYSNYIQVELLLGELNHYVNKLIPYNLNRVKDVEVAFGKRNGLIPLSFFVKEGFGVCRQHALLAAYILETLIKNNRFPDGNVAVHKNGISGVGGHAWAVYRSVRAGSEDVIIDPTQQFVGTRNDSRKLKRWPYALTNEQLKWS